MGRWVPTPGTIYRHIVDRCFDAFSISREMAREPICYGDPVGRNCTCSFEAGDYWFWIKTPQQLGQPISPAFQELNSWLWSGRFWTRKTGILLVGRLVDKDLGHLDWIEPRIVARGFGLYVSSLQIDYATRTLQAATADADWSSPELQSDGSFRLVETTSSDPRAVRFYRLFETSTSKIIAGEASSVIALSVFDYPRGYRSDIAISAIRDMSDHQRFESLVYEFDLSGNSSFDFQVAGQ